MQLFVKRFSVRPKGYPLGRHSGAPHSGEPGIQSLACAPSRLVIPGCAEGAGPESIRPLAPWRNGFLGSRGACHQARSRDPVARPGMTSSGAKCLPHKCIPHRHNLPVAPICRTSFSLRRRANQNDALACLALIRGAARDRHGRWERDAMDAHRRAQSLARRAALVRTAKSCGPGAPMQAPSLRRRLRVS